MTQPEYTDVDDPIDTVNDISEDDTVVVSFADGSDVSLDVTQAGGRGTAIATADGQANGEAKINGVPILGGKITFDGLDADSDVVDMEIEG